MHHGKAMHCREEVMHSKRKNLCIVKETHTVQEKEIVYPYRIIVHQSQPQPFIFTRVNTRKIIEDDIKRNISTPQQLLFILTSNEDYIANIRHKIYLLYVKPNGVDVKCSTRTLSAYTVKDTVSHFNCIFMLTSFISYLARAFERMNSPKKNTIGAEDIKKDAAQHETFLSANLDIVQRGVSSSKDTSRGETSTTIKPHPYQKACGFFFSFFSFSSHTEMFVSI